MAPKCMTDARRHGNRLQLARTLIREELLPVHLNTDAQRPSCRATQTATMKGRVGGDWWRKEVEQYKMKAAKASG